MRTSHFWLLMAMLAGGTSATAFAEGLDVKVMSITSSVNPGGAVKLVVETEPGATCGGVRQAHGGEFVPLKEKAVGRGGLAVWNFRMQPGNHPVGRRDIEVTCSSGGRRGSLKTFFVVE